MKTHPLHKGKLRQLKRISQELEAKPISTSEIKQRLTTTSFLYTITSISTPRGKSSITMK